MKVHEIISEGLASELLSKGVGVAAKLFGGPAKKEAVEKLADVWAKEIAQHGKMVTPADKIIQKELAADASVLDNAAKKAMKLAPKASRAGDIAILKISAAKYASRLNTLVQVGIATEPIVQYNYRMNKWKQKLDAGDITEEEYEAIRQREMATMVTQMAAAVGGLAVFKSVAFGGKFLLGWIPGIGKIINPLLTTASTAAGVGLAAWWASDTGRKWLAWVICDAFVDLSPILGGGITKLIDMFQDKVDELTNKTPTNKTGGQAGANKGSTTPAAPVATQSTPQQSYQPKSLTGTNMQGTDITTPDGQKTFDIGWK